MKPFLTRGSRPPVVAEMASRREAMLAEGFPHLEAGM
jgi:hypothetical protein